MPFFVTIQAFNECLDYMAFQSELESDKVPL